MHGRPFCPEPRCKHTSSLHSQYATPVKRTTRCPTHSHDPSAAQRSGAHHQLIQRYQRDPHRLHAAEDSVVPTDRRAVLIILLLRVHIGEELVRLGKDRATEPHCVALERVRHYVHVDLRLDA